jgi:hypothetical protein
MRSTCNNCKALNSIACRLGFKTKVTFSANIKNKIEGVKPGEPCPKPITNRDYIHYANKTLDFISVNSKMIFEYSTKSIMRGDRK